MAIPYAQELVSSAAVGRNHSPIKQEKTEGTELIDSDGHKKHKETQKPFFVTFRAFRGYRISVSSGASCSRVMSVKSVIEIVYKQLYEIFVGARRSCRLVAPARQLHWYFFFLRALGVLGGLNRSKN